jgi:hypothetical protein
LPRRFTTLALLIAVSASTVGRASEPGTEAPPKTPLDAYDDGYMRGIGPPLIGWGSAYTLSGVVILAASGLGSSSGVTKALRIVGGVGLGLGAAQLIAGIVTLVSHPRPRGADELGLPFDAGYDHGWGNAMIGYGSVMLASTITGIVTAASDGGNASSWGNVGISAAIAGLHLGFGIVARRDGIAFRDALMAEPALPPSATEPLSDPPPTPPGEPTLPPAVFIPLYGTSF